MPSPIQSSSPPRPRALRPPRQEVRERLVDGAMEAFAERGFMGASVDFICAKAGFSRGALYSNFEDKDALFFALYDRQAGFIRARIEYGLQCLAGRDDPLAALAEVLAEPDPDELRWDILNKEFIVHALRNEGARQRLAAQRAVLRGRIAGGIRTALVALGRSDVADEEADEIARFVIALHEGDLTQRGLEPEARAVPTLEARFVPLIVEALARPVAPRDAAPGVGTGASPGANSSAAGQLDAA